MPTNRAATPGHVRPHMGIHIVDMGQPPGMGMSSMVDMDPHATTVAAVQTANSNAQTP
jgi:hypothetical protein